MRDDSFIRWQGITVSQFTYSLNLILGLSVAALGFGIVLLVDNNFIPFGTGKYIFSISLLIQLFSIVFGIFCVINRLRDFRITTKITREREKDGRTDIIENLRNLSDKLGKRTWKLFNVHTGLFFSGVLLMIISLVLTYYKKLI